MDESSAPDAFLDRALTLLDWRALAPWIAAVESKVGMPVSIALYKMILLERWFQLSGGEIDDACHARAAFRRFLGAPLHGPVAEVWMHRQLAPKLAAANLEVGKLISAAELLLADRGLAPPTCSWTGSDTAEMVAPNAGIRTTVFEPGRLSALARQAESSARITYAHAGVDPGQPSGSENAGRQARATALLVWPWGGTTPIHGTLRIGRDPEFSAFARQLWADPKISRRHAELEPAPVGILLRDLGSANGSFVGDERLPYRGVVILDDDARLRFGPSLAVKLVFYPDGIAPSS